MVTGMIISAFLKLESKSYAFLGFLGIGLIAPLFLILGLNLSFFRLVIVICLVVLVVSGRFERFNYNWMNNVKNSWRIEIFILAIAFLGFYFLFREAIGVNGIRLFSLGNADPVNYAIVAKNIVKNGIETIPSMYQANLSAVSTWDWMSAQTILAFISMVMNRLPSDIVFPLYAVMFTLISKTLIQTNKTTNIFIKSLVITSLTTLGLLPYIIGSGFIAQTFSLYTFINILSLVSSFKNKENKEKFIIIILSNILLFNLYLPGFLVSVTLILLYFVANFFNHGNEFFKIAKFELVIVKVIAVIPFTFLLLTPGFNYLITNAVVITNDVSPGWSCSSNSLIGMVFSQFNCFDNRKNLSFTLILIFVLFLIFTKVIKIQFKKIYFLMFLVIPIIIIISFLDIESLTYRIWKSIAYLQLFFVFLISRHLLHNLSKNRQTSLTLRIISIVLFSFISYQNLGNSMLLRNNTYAFSATPEVQRLQSVGKLPFYSEIDIGVGGMEGMLIAAYLPNPRFNFVQDTPYYSGTKKKYKVSLEKLDDMNKSKEKEAIPNTDYFLIFK